MKSGLQILMVEDNPGDADLVNEMLSEAAESGYDIKNAGSLADARTFLKTGSFDVVLLDLGLPDSQGLDTLRGILADASFSPVIVMTGLDDEHTGTLTVQEGAQDYLVKGKFDGPSLMREIRYAIERKRVENELINARKWETIARLAGGIAHDFNNLHTIIAGYIELAKDSIPPENPAASHLNEAEAACRSAKSLTRQFIAFTKQGGTQMKTQHIQETLKNLAQKALGENRVTPVVHIDPHLWPVTCDLEQLKQALNNLIDNAKDAMPEGGHITLSANNLELTDSRYELSSGRYVLVQIDDTGKGIAKDYQAMVFDPYFSMKQRGSEKGMGLGLAVAQAIIYGHGGQIKIDSEEERGTSVCVYLPAS